MTTTGPIRIPAGNPGPLTGSGNNTWLLTGSAPTLIDAGTGLPAHIAAIERILGPQSLARVLVTHGHADHASGVPALRQVWPDLDVRKFLLPGESDWKTLADGDVVRAGDRTLSVLHSPGHAADHVCFWDADEGSVYGGDMVLAGTSVLIPAGRGGSLRQYLASLERLAALRPRRIYPGHGEIIEQPVVVLEQYIAHRQLRERQILACLQDGVVDPDAIVRAIYTGIPDELRPAARLTVQAHLDKLREDGVLS